MSERAPTQNKQILDKLDNLTSEISGIKEDIAVVKNKIEMQPRIDTEKFSSLTNTQINCKKDCEKADEERKKEIAEIRENQVWATRTLIIEGVGLVMTLVGVIFALIK